MLGILSIVLVVVTFPLACMCCCAFLPLPVTIPLSVGATVTGAIAVRNPEGRPMAVAGLVLGIISLGFVLLHLIFGFAPFMVGPPPPQPGRVR